MEVISDFAVTAIIQAPIGKIDLTDWLFTLKDHEYQACSHAHLAAGSSIAKDGRRLSLNVELVGGSLLVQHYREDISQRDHCLVHSHSDSLSPAGNTKLSVTWELKLRRLSDSSCEFSNRVMISFTEELYALLRQSNLTDLEPIKNSMSERAKEYNREETPLFAKDIESKALAGVWG